MLKWTQPAHDSHARYARVAKRAMEFRIGTDLGTLQSPARSTHKGALLVRRMRAFMITKEKRKFLRLHN